MRRVELRARQADVTRGVATSFFPPCGGFRPLLHLVAALPPPFLTISFPPLVQQCFLSDGRDLYGRYDPRLRRHRIGFLILIPLPQLGKIIVISVAWVVGICMRYRSYVSWKTLAGSYSQTQIGSAFLLSAEALEGVLVSLWTVCQRGVCWTVALRIG